MSGWLIGYLVGAAVVVVVAAVLLTMIVLARRAAETAEDILEALERARDNTHALWLVKDTNVVADRIVTALSAARGFMQGAHPSAPEQEREGELR